MVLYHNKTKNIGAGRSSKRRRRRRIYSKEKRKSFLENHGHNVLSNYIIANRRYCCIGTLRVSSHLDDLYTHIHKNTFLKDFLGIYLNLHLLLIVFNKISIRIYNHLLLTTHTTQQKNLRF